MILESDDNQINTKTCIIDLFIHFQYQSSNCYWLILIAIGCHQLSILLIYNAGFWQNLYAPIVNLWAQQQISIWRQRFVCLFVCIFIPSDWWYMYLSTNILLLNIISVHKTASSQWALRLQLVSFYKVVPWLRLTSWQSKVC